MKSDPAPASGDPTRDEPTVPAGERTSRQPSHGVVAGKRGTLDVGFVPAECPGMDGTGATRTSSLLVERLSKHHDLTVYVASQYDATSATLPATDRVEYVLHDGLSHLPHPTKRKIDTLRASMDALNDHDLVHSYSSAFMPVLADLTVPTVSTLNSYLPVCPKEDLLYHDQEKCTGPGRVKCASCVFDVDVDLGRDLETGLKSAFVSLGKMGLIEESIDRSDEIDAYHAISPHIRDDYIDFGFPADRITVVPHFYEETFRRRDDYHEFDDERITLLYVGRLQWNKGPHVLVNALPEMKARGYDVALRIAGTGPDEQALRSLAATHGIADRIDWLGYVDHADLPSEFHAADAFVYPGLLDEPFGRVLLEALGTRTPVLASDVGSTDYIVGDGGVRFEPGNPAGLVDAFETLVSNYEAYYGAISDHVDRFAPQRIERELLDLYDRVAHRRVVTGEPTSA